MRCWMIDGEIYKWPVFFGIDFFQKNVGMEKRIHVFFVVGFFCFFARIVLLIHFEEWIHAYPVVFQISWLVNQPAP